MSWMGFKWNRCCNNDVMCRLITMSLDSSRFVPVSRQILFAFNSVLKFALEHSYNFVSACAETCNNNQHYDTG